MKCDRRWWNDGRVHLEGEEQSVRFWLRRAPWENWGIPFFAWWIGFDQAEVYRQRQAASHKSFLRIVLPDAEAAHE